MKNRIIAVGLILLASVFLFNKSCVFSAEMDLAGVKVPLLAGSRDIWGGLQELEVNGISTQALGYVVGNSAQAIIDFYKAHLPDWKFQESWPGLNIAYFTKEEKYLYVVVGNFLLQGYEHAGKNTKFTLILSKKPLHLCFYSAQVLQNESEGRDLPFLPRYPGSRRTLGIIRGEKEAFFVYISREEAAKIVDFYNRNLAVYGWKPVQKLTLPRTCFDAVFSAAGLVFERGNDNLMVYLSYCPDIQGNVITLSYNLVFSVPPVTGAVTNSR